MRASQSQIFNSYSGSFFPSYALHTTDIKSKYVYTVSHKKLEKLELEWRDSIWYVADDFNVLANLQERARRLHKKMLDQDIPLQIEKLSQRIDVLLDIIKMRTYQ